jgi:diguanylate cyclase (GGDEF)-like protein
VDTEGAYKCVDGIRDAIKHLSLHNRGQTIGTVTVSAGIATYPANGGNSEDLLHAADNALYRAKKAGRDRIFICESLESSTTSADKSI